MQKNCRLVDESLGYRDERLDQLIPRAELFPDIRLLWNLSLSSEIVRSGILVIIGWTLHNTQPFCQAAYLGCH